MPINPLMINCYHLWEQRSRGARYRLHFLIEEGWRVWVAECQRVLRPWLSWVELTSYQWVKDFLVSPPRPASELDRWLVLSTDETLMQAVEAAAGSLSTQIILPRLPHHLSPSHDAMREMLHFDFMYGGYNEWTEKMTPDYSQATVNNISIYACRRRYPHWAFEGIDTSRTPLKVLEIGCGPVSFLRWGALHDEVIITGVDPLIELYQIVRAHHGYDHLPNIACAREIPDYAENLDQHIPDESHDIAYTINSLDHTQQPEVVMKLLARKIPIGGRIAFEVSTREGTRQQWDQFHKTDIDYVNGEVVFRHQDTNYAPLLGPNLRLTKVHTYTDDYLAALAERVR